MIDKLKIKSKQIVLKITKQVIDNSHQQDQQYNDLLYLFDRYVNHGYIKSSNFNFNAYADEVIKLVESMKTSEPFSYRYSSSNFFPTLYGSVFACLLFFLLSKDDYLSPEQKNSWADYFDSFQNDEGLFVDSNLLCENYYNYEWWGARHLSPIIIICYNYLGRRPQKEFNYIKKYYNPKILREYLNKLEFNEIIHTDSDNAIMNLGVILQYQRDFFYDYNAAETLEILFNELEKLVNPKYGSWGYGSDNDMVFLSRTQQFAYHLYPLWIYDNRSIKHVEKLIDLSLQTQTILGGFGAYINSSACEDIDCIDLLIKLTKVTSYRIDDVKMAMLKALPWVLSNQDEDGGFVFRRNEPFTYGHALMSSQKNESHLFATWFRSLTVAYLVKFLNMDSKFNIGHCPGYHFL